MSGAEIRVLIRYIQVIATFLIFIVLYYLGITWSMHKIGFCVISPNESCEGPFYHARHIPGAFISTIVLFLILFFPVSSLMDRWKKDVEREEARIQEKEKDRFLERHGLGKR